MRKGWICRPSVYNGRDAPTMVRQAVSALVDLSWRAGFPRASGSTTGANTKAGAACQVDPSRKDRSVRGELWRCFPDWVMGGGGR